MPSRSASAAIFSQPRLRRNPAGRLVYNARRMPDVALSRFYVLAAAVLFSTGGAAIKGVALSS